MRKVLVGVALLLALASCATPEAGQPVYRIQAGYQFPEHCGQLVREWDGCKGAVVVDVWADGRASYKIPIGRREYADATQGKDMGPSGVGLTQVKQLPEGGVEFFTNGRKWVIGGGPTHAGSYVRVQLIVPHERVPTGGQATYALVGVHVIHYHKQ